MDTVPGYPPLADAYRVTAKRWARGWELYLGDGDDHVTQSHGLADAEYMARDYLRTLYDLTDAEADALSIEIVAERASRAGS